MYFFLILFFVSLGAITFMIGRKLLLINNIGEHQTPHAHENFLSEILDANKIKKSVIENGGKIIHAIIWITLRTYLISSNFLNKKIKEISEKIKNKLNKNKNSDIIEDKKEVSRYIKMISEYRHKIRKIKHKIKEEEGIE